jgi:glycosyltransferase involved in cell wall biosynthesis
MATDKKVRVLLLNDHLGWNDQIHGVARLFLLWASHLDPRRFDVKICILREPGSLRRIFDERGLDVAYLNKSKFDPTTTTDLVKLIRKERIDLLHIQGYGSTTLGRLAGMITGVPMVVHFHDTRDYYPLIQQVSDRLLGRFASAYLAVSQSAKVCWARRYRIDAERIKVLPNCTSLDEFIEPDTEQIDCERRHWGIAAETRIVGTVTRLFEGKGTEYLLQAAPTVLKAFPDTAFVIVGDGPRREELQEFAQQLGIQEHVVFTGYTKRIAPLLGMFDVKVLTSHHSEGSPLSVIEAMAMGKPVIVTDIVDTVEDGVDGIVIPPRNAAVLAEKIVYLFSNRDEARRLGAAARKAARRFDVKNCVRTLEEVYEACQARRFLNTGS